VLHLVASLDCGGAERQLFLLCRQTAGRVRHEVLAVRSEGRWAEPLRELGVPVTCLRTSLRNPLSIPRIANHARSSAPDLVHAWLPSANILAALAVRRPPVVAGVRNVDDWKPRAYRLLDRLVSPLWSAVICNSHAGAERARLDGLPERKVHVVTNGIDQAAPLPRPRNGRLVVCAVCRLVPQKRVDRVLTVARELPEAAFLIAGDGPERARLEPAAPANVRFLGDQADPSWIFASADCFLLCSEREGTSNALLESMQAGCVPVVTAAGDNGRIVEDRVSGRVVPAEGLADALREIGPFLEDYRAAAVRAASRHTVAAMADGTLEIYRRVLMHEIHDANLIPGLHQ
jgi:glycosyltransferase involved in cell wall biosynthesis